MFLKPWSFGQDVSCSLAARIINQRGIFMVGFSSHFAIGIALAGIFVLLDRKSRYRTLIVGGFAAALPDIDFLGVFVDFIEHRGVTHDFLTWFGASLVALAIVAILTWLDYRADKNQLIADVLLDKLIYFVVFTVGWASHIVVDFGFTGYNDQMGLIRTISQETLNIAEQGTGFLAALILSAIIWRQSFNKERQLRDEAKIFIPLLTNPDLIQDQQDQLIISQLRLIQKFRISISDLEAIFGANISKSILDRLKDADQTLGFKLVKDVIIFQQAPRLQWLNQRFNITFPAIHNPTYKVLLYLSLTILLFISLGFVVGFFQL